MRTITRTVYGARLQSLQFFGLPYTHVDNTTLNEKLGIFPDQRPSPGEIPRNRYFCISNRGHRLAVGADGFPLTDELPHQPSDGGPYGIVPFILRRASDDLDPATRSKYCLRRQEVHNGENFVAYYGKRFSLAGAEVGMFTNTVDAGVTTTVPFVPTSANLNPAPPSIPPTGSVTVSGDYMSVSTMVDLSMSETETAEFIEVAKILFGDERHAVISEIMTVAGCDRMLTAGSLTYNEVVEAQVTAFIADYHAVRYSNKGLDLTLDVGAVEPLLTFG